MSEVVDQPALVAPTPSVTSDTEEFWSATAEGRLLLRCCNACGATIWYPRPICPFCHSSETEWRDSTGRGSIYSFTIVRRASGEFADAVPYVLAYVELAEGPRVLTNVVDSDPEALFIGQEVEVVFHKTASTMALPRFRPL